MPHALIPTLLLQILLIGYTPGPANIYALIASLKHTKREALTMWTGLFVGFSIAVCIMAILTHLIGIAFGEHVVYLKYLGAAYIAYLAYKVYTSSRKAEDTGADCSFLSGMIVQMTNAKMLLFDLTVFSTFVLPYSSNLTDLLKAGAWLLLAGPGANLVWLLAGSYMKSFFCRYGKLVDMVSAAALLCCAIYISFS